VGDNFKIIGGCGLNMSQVNVETMSMGEEKYKRYNEIIAKNSYEKLYIVEINGKKYGCFKLKCVNNFDFIWTELRLLKNNAFLYGEPETAKNFLGDE
jgi:hypothetical protein